MPSINAYTATGAKSATKVNLNKDVFGIVPENHQILKDAYVAYLANGRVNLAKTKTRGEVSGSTKKPWKQKGTGRARFGSRYNPIWRGGGITFGPTGNENYTKKIPTQTKRLAVKQALSLAAKDGVLNSIDSLSVKDGKVSEVVKVLKKIDAKGRTLIIVEEKTENIDRATRNIANVKVTQAKYLNVFDILNADMILATKSSLEEISKWLGGKK
ncbi:50S ribosomal protein L4 [Candidatus Saccharibacteria bacterium]|nr:50S ribosomal protein L4 [Candidatus Saccharibacteria bacterium]